MKQLKDIFGRKSSRWLFLELVLVTFALWWAFDPILVSAYVTHLPLGYDAERLVKLEVATSVTREEQDKHFGDFLDEEELLLQKARELDDVELAYSAFTNPMGFGVVGMSCNYFVDGDTLTGWRYEFAPESRMFEVYGIQSLTPEVPTHELTHDCEDDVSVIITRTMAMGLYGTTDVAGRKLTGRVHTYDDGDFKWVNRDYRIRAVVEDVRHYEHDRDLACIFICSDGYQSNTPIILRLRNGVNAERFIQSHQRQVETELTTEHYYVRSMQSCLDAQSDASRRTNVGRTTRRNLLIAAFFAVNLSFGVFGTLLMYTRQRREETGIRRAFGATKRNVFLGFLREAWLLTTISVIVGCIIEFQFAAAGGLSDEYAGVHSATHFWFDSFGSHFLVVSACVYLIILGTVLVATAIPAWRISRSEITESLKDE